MTVYKNIPQYYSYKDIYSEYLVGRQIHSCLINRFSNDTMFVGKTKRLEELYHQATKLYVILETLSELFNDNPIYRCNRLITDEVYLPIVIDTDIEEKYVGYFNKLYSCLKTTIDRIKTCKKGLSAQYMIEKCSYEYYIGAGDNGDCIIGDYNNDYNDDYFVEKCNIQEGQLKSLITCNVLYVINYIKNNNITIDINSISDFNIGDKIELGNASDNIGESVVFTIVNIHNESIIVDGIIASDNYKKLAKIGEANYTIVYNIKIIKSYSSVNNQYTIDSSNYNIPDNTSVIITDVNGEKYYDVVLSSTIKGSEIILNMSIAAINTKSIVSFEVTNYIVNSSSC